MDNAKTFPHRRKYFLSWCPLTIDDTGEIIFNDLYITNRSFALQEWPHINPFISLRPPDGMQNVLYKDTPESVCIMKLRMRVLI